MKKLRLNTKQLNVLKQYITISRIESKVTFHTDYYNLSDCECNKIIDKVIECYERLKHILSEKQFNKFLAMQEEIESNYTFTLIDYDTYKQFLRVR